EAEAALDIGGLAALLWASVMMQARPADPRGQWMAELLTAALRKLRNVLTAPTVVLAAEAASGDITAAAAAATPLSESAGASLQDMASLLSALQQMMYDPGPDWINTCLQAAAEMQARTDPSAAVNAAAATGSPQPGDALAAVMFLAAQYDHPQDDETRGSVVGMAQEAQAWMQLQEDVAAAAAVEAATAVGSQAAPPPLFSSRGLTQLLMALVRMGGRPSEEWVAAWAAAAEPLMRCGGGSGGFNVDQMVAVLATAAEADVQLPEQLQRAIVQGLLRPQPAVQTTPNMPAPTAAPAGAATPGISGPGAFLPAGPGAAATDVATGSSGAAVRSLMQFRQLLAILELQTYLLETDWLEHFVALVEDFRLGLSSRDLLAVLRVLGSFRDTLLMDTSDAAVQLASPSRPVPSSSPAQAGHRPATTSATASATTSATSSSRRPGGPLVLRPRESPAAAGSSQALPPFPFPSATSSPQSPGAAPPPKARGLRDISAASSSPPAILDSAWLRSLLEDLKVRGGVRGPNDLMQLAQALSALSAPPSLMSYVEVFAVAITGEDGRRRAPTPRMAVGATPPAVSGLAAGTEPSSLAATAKPSVARIRLRLQQEAREQKAAAAAPAAQVAATATNGAAAGAGSEEEEEETQQWSLAWPAMLGAFAASGHIPERRWWDRFAAATLPALELYEGPRLTSTAMAALGLSSQAAAASAGSDKGGDEEEEDKGTLAAKLLPSLDWHQRALTCVAEAIRSCPTSMDEVREQAVQVLSEQRRQSQRVLGMGEDVENDAVELTDGADSPHEEFTSEELSE
ncbi:hypothetical protein VaNZ11_013800, partial [Volvox africanus]